MPSARSNLVARNRVNAPNGQRSLATRVVSAPNRVDTRRSALGRLLVKDQEVDGLTAILATNPRTNVDVVARSLPRNGVTVVVATNLRTNAAARPRSNPVVSGQEDGRTDVARSQLVVTAESRPSAIHAETTKLQVLPTLNGANAVSATSSRRSILVSNARSPLISTASSARRRNPSAVAEARRSNPPRNTPTAVVATNLRTNVAARSNH